MELVATRNFLLRQEPLAGGKKKDVHARKGEKVKVTDEEAIKFWGGFDIPEKEAARLNKYAKTNKLRRTI